MSVSSIIVQYLLNLLTVLATSNNLPILYNFSTEYRKIINQYLKKETTDLLYLTFNNAGFSLTLLLPIAFKNLLVCVGII
uniref:Uncharacterized protein n=1 Tax=Ditylenchus dipsaci TaxID=166011 RepID=A0A915D0B0_9BILA